jgi:hypothetical protein
VSRPPPFDDAIPLTAERSRLHVTVSRRFLAKLEAARDARSHARPDATVEDLLEEALDLLLAREAARREGAVTRRPPPARPSSPDHVPAAVRREVWARDAGRCQWPLASGGTCGSTRRLELDHVVPLALGGPSTPGNLRVLCQVHNLEAARRALGAAVMDRYTRRGAAHLALQAAHRLDHAGERGGVGGGGAAGPPDVLG